MTDIPVSYITDKASSSTSSTTSTSSTSSSSSSSATGWSSQTFLKLLVAQLKYQDPSSPMDSAAMMSQLSQMATVEQLTSMNDTSKSSMSLLQRMSAASMVGQTVSWSNSTTSATSSGKVASVTFTSDDPTLTMTDGTTVALSKLATLS